MDCLWTTLPPIWSEHAHSSVYNQMAFVIDRNDFDGLRQLIVRFFLCPQLIWILFVFLLKIHCIAPQVAGGQLSRNVKKCWCHSCQGFCKFARCSYLTIFLVLESNLIFQRSCLFKSNCWNEIREMSVFESIFFLKIKFLRSKIQHTLFNAVLWLSCISKTKMTSWKIKMTLFMVLCVSFNLWSLGIPFDGLRWGDLLWISRNKRLKSKLEDSSRKIVFFF